MDDLISRQWLMECVNEGWIKFDTEKDKNRFIHLVRDIAPSAQPIQTASNYLQSLPTSPLLVGKMPPAQPEPKWIPCNEKLPEGEYVLISKKPTKLSGSKWCVTIAIRMADPRSRKVNWRDIGFDVIQDNEVLAWMPLPEPYEERREEWAN